MLKVKSTLTSFTLIHLFIGSLSACQLWAVISNSTEMYLHQDSLLITSQLEHFQNAGIVNRDGWSLLYYQSSDPVIQPETQVWRSPIPSYIDSSFTAACQSILSSGNAAVLANGHIRNASSGADSIPNPHPFLYNWNDHTLTFGHNGTLSKDHLLELLTDFGQDSSWILQNPPADHGCGYWLEEGWDCVVDSDLYFRWILKNIQLNDDIQSGLLDALSAIENPLQADSYLTGAKNFTFTDGSNLYAYRSGGSYSGPPLYYAQEYNQRYETRDDIPLMHTAVMTYPTEEGLATELDWTMIDNRCLVKFAPDTDPEFFLHIGGYYMLGDVNQDTVIDVLDIFWTVAIIIGSMDVGEYELWAADFDHNGEINISDINWMVNVILYFS